MLTHGPQEGYVFSVGSAVIAFVMQNLTNKKRPLVCLLQVLYTFFSEKRQAHPILY